MRYQTALSLHEFAGLPEAGRKRKRRRKGRRRQRRRQSPQARQPVYLAQQPVQLVPVQAVPAQQAQVVDAEVVEETAGEPWGPLTALGPRMRVQAAAGYRAAVIELKPGLFVVAEVPAHVVRSEFGIVPLLAPLVVQAASRALVEQQATPGQAPAPTQPASSTQLLANHDARRAMLLNAAAQQLTPPAAVAGLVPAAGYGHGHQRLLPPPAVGRWVDADDLAGVIGCDACGGRCRGRR